MHWPLKALTHAYNEFCVLEAYFDSKKSAFWSQNWQFFLILQKFSVVSCRPKTCSCPFLRHFCTLFLDDIRIICWWNLSKQTSYWFKTDGFFPVKKVNNFLSLIIVITSQNNVQKNMNKFQLFQTIAKVQDPFEFLYYLG